MINLKETIGSDSNTDEEELEGEDSSFTVTTSQAVFGQNQTEKSSKTLLERQNDQSFQKPEEESEMLLMVNCPTCGVKYPVSDIEEIVLWTSPRS